MQPSFFDYAMEYQGGKKSTKFLLENERTLLQARKRELRAKGIFNGITERRVRGQSKLRVKQSKNNTKFLKSKSTSRTSICFYKKAYEIYRN